MPEAESDALLAALDREAETPESQCRVRWEPRTVTVWDDRAGQRCAASDDWPRRRVMERVTIDGERPR